MFGPKVTLTREELYEKVWSIPMQKFTAEFGFSDRGLAKLCRRYEVVVPPSWLLGTYSGRAERQAPPFTPREPSQSEHD